MDAQSACAASDEAQSPAVRDGAAELIPAIDADGALYPVEKLEAHRLGLKHLAISAFVFDADGRLLLQQRAAGKYHSGLAWANTVCSHPRWGETLAACARRRLREELGVGLRLRPAGVLEYRAEVSGGLVEHEQVHAFAGLADGPLAFTPDAREVAAVRWATLPALRREAAAAPGEFAPWLRIYLDRWEELRLPVG